jgi:hypothetical protein
VRVFATAYIDLYRSSDDINVIYTIDTRIIDNNTCGSTAVPFKYETTVELLEGSDI